MYPPQRTIARAKELRQTMTLPEVVLWQALRGRKLGGARFRRQHPIGPYILDFYCDEARLAVEVDGASHEHPDQMQHDSRRTEWLNLREITVHRIAAREVLGNLEGVLAGLRERVCVGPPPPRRRGSVVGSHAILPPPPMGQEG